MLAFCPMPRDVQASIDRIAYPIRRSHAYGAAFLSTLAWIEWQSSVHGAAPLWFGPVSPDDAPSELDAGYLARDWADGVNAAHARWGSPGRTTEAFLAYIRGLSRL